MRAAFVASALLALASSAIANPITLGVGLGRTQDKVDAQSDASHAYSVFGRLELGRRVSGQLELGKFEPAGTQGAGIATATALVLLDLVDGAKSKLVPVVFAGVGADRQSPSGYGDIDGKHVEGGLALEYRAAGGLVIGADVRIGARAVDTSYAVPQTLGVERDANPIGLVPCAPDTCGGAYQPLMRDGEYRAAHVTAGIRF